MRVESYGGEERMRITCMHCYDWVRVIDGPPRTALDDGPALRWGRANR